MPQPALRITHVSLDDLHPDPANVRAHPERNLESIKASLQEFGQRKPIVVNSDGKILAGNGTYLAARALGWEKIAVVRADLGSAAREAAFAIADNRTGELAVWDMDALGTMLAALHEESEQLLASSGFSLAELEKLLANTRGSTGDGRGLERWRDPEDGAEETLQYQCPRCKYEWDGAPR